ncbi:MAG: LysM peptidoglycan-binding domain-containing protein [Gemmatimonadota bacterium]|nr:LysM peptidoglycan-binding domain-containing protein [Gemmatimonadota bacterium]
MRHHRFRTLLAIAAAVGGAPAVAVAQEPTGRPATHTVKKGDTLWDLAREYLGDPFQWPQIYRLNGELIKDPHWIYPGQVFKLPGGTAVAPAAAAPSGQQQQAGPRASRTSTMTVFDPRTRGVGAAASRQALLTAAPRTAVRAGEYLQSPFMWAVGGPADGGHIDGTAETLGVGINADVRPIQALEEVYVTLPRGTAASPGARLMSYRLGDVITGQGQVVVPTGIVRITKDVGKGRALAVLVEKFEDVFAAQGVTAADTLAMPVNVFPNRVEFGLSTRVTWVHLDPQLAMPGNKVILAAGSGQGLVTGDQLSLRLMPAGSDGAGDAEVAIAQVTRVTPWGATATLLSVRDGGIAPGMRAQVSAKMP